MDDDVLGALQMHSNKNDPCPQKNLFKSSIDIFKKSQLCNVKTTW